jgi:tRNA dimethylallyltransferase
LLTSRPSFPVKVIPQKSVLKIPLMPKPRIVFLVGPTAAGKSKVAIHLAKHIRAEIISCDSMQIYKGMRIVSCLADKTSLKTIKHHLIESVSPCREFNVYLFLRQAEKLVKEIIKKGKTPLFVGGTGLYMSALIDGLFPEAGCDQSIRGRLSAICKKKGSFFLHQKLTRVDPAAAGKIHPNDARRIIRALEVYEATGKKISELQKQRKGLSVDYDVRIFCLNMDRNSLYQNINKRVDDMFGAGLVEEVKKLLKLKLSRTALYAIGIREIAGLLGASYDPETAKELIKANTRRYAKRQLTWFRKDKRIKWIKLNKKESAYRTAQKIWKKLS